MRWHLISSGAFTFADFLSSASGKIILKIFPANMN
jgi:hypothetical protein